MKRRYYIGASSTHGNFVATGNFVEHKQEDFFEILAQAVADSQLECKGAELIQNLKRVVSIDGVAFKVRDEKEKH